MRVLHPWFALIFILFAASCTSRTGTLPETRSLEKITYQEISRMIEEDLPSKAFQWILGLRKSSTNLLSGEQLATLEKNAGEKLTELFNNALKNKDYGRAATYFLTMENLEGLSPPPDWNRDRLLFHEAEEYRTSGNIVLALYTFLKIEDFSERTEESLKTYADISIEINNTSALRRFAAIFLERGLEFSGERNTAMNKVPSPAEMMSGTVTIWVNRGIRIERGVGLPDRVIGSGFFIDPRGYLLTNYHVISSEVDPAYEGYSRLFVRPSNRPEDRIPARVVGYSRIFDLALLKVEKSPPYVFGVTEVQELTAGSRIFAIGSPGGLDNTITSGIISATGRRFLQMGDAMQMDVPVNPGSSGGPLIDESGRLVGIVFAGIEQFEGVNFAIPGYWIRKFLPKLYREGEVVHAWLGLSVNETKNELEVLYSVPRTPAHEAGIVFGDKIRRINDIPVHSIRDAQDVLLSLEPEALVPVVYSRDGKDRVVLVALDNRPFSPLERPLGYEAKEKLFPPLFGFSARSLSSGFFSEDYAVERVFPGSIADESSISENDPFTVRRWLVDKDLRLVLMQLVIKKRKAGFLEGGVQLGSYFEKNNVI